eukprot:4302796-Prorocentrum_lima.AAC.1
MTLGDDSCEHFGDIGLHKFDPKECSMVLYYNRFAVKWFKPPVQEMMDPMVVDPPEPPAPPLPP